MGQYDRQIASARRLIAKYGQQVKWQKRENGAPASATEEWKPGPTIVTEYDVQIAFLPDTRMGFEFLSMMAGTEVPTGKIVGYMAAPADFTPSLKDTIKRGDEEIGIRTLDQLAPNGQAILYTIGLDR